MTAAVVGPGAGEDRNAGDGRRARSFGAVAGAYARSRPGYPTVAVDWLVPADARTVLDLGAGTGKLTASLIGRGAKVVAVEPDPEMLAELRRSLPSVDARLGTAEQVPVPDGSVDAVLVGQAWHWFDADRALAEVRRVLRPGGTLGLLWNMRTEREPWQRALSDLAGDATAVVGDIRGVDALPRGEARDVEWEEDLTPEGLCDRVSTFSAVLTRSPVAREEVLDAVLALARAEAARAGRETVRVAYLTRCLRVVPSPS